MHFVFVLADQKCAVRKGHNIRQFIRGRTDNCLQTHFAEQPDALYDPLTVHFVESFVKYHETDGVIGKTGQVVHLIDLGKGGKDGNVEGRLRFTAGFGIQGLGQHLFGAVLIGGLQVELQVGAEVGKACDIFLKLTLLPVIQLRIIGCGNTAEKVS